MGTGEGGTPTKTSKTSTPQEPPSTPSYTEWAAAFQAYYGPGATPPPRGYFPSTVASGPQPLPYIWGGQPMMPPYGTPPPHAALYTYGGIYTHPPGARPFGQYGLTSPSTEITMAPAPSGTDAEAKPAEGKDRNTSKKMRGSLGSLGMLTGKGTESAKATSASANGHSPSGDSGSDGSTEGSDETTQNGSQYKGDYNEQGRMDGTGGESFVNPAVGNPVSQQQEAMAAAVTGKPVLGVGPATNLNIGMDYWSGNTNKPGSKRNNSSSALVSASPTPPHFIGPASTDLWLQDERELKRQRRKQSNRESARRSRLRKQAECEELSTRVDTLTVENVALKTELNRLAEECKRLSEENTALLEQLGDREPEQEQQQDEQQHEEQEVSHVTRTDDNPVSAG